MSVLVTGGAGYIGSHMTHALADAGERVVVLDTLQAGRRDLVAPAAQFVRGDVADGALLADILARHQVTDVLHFAGSTSVPESTLEPLSYYRNNVANTLVLLERMEAASVERLIFSSTAAIYRMTGATNVSESHPIDPASPYGHTKLAAEHMIAALVAKGALCAGVLRYFNVAGADPAQRTGQSTPKATHLIKIACEVACGRRESISIYGTDWPTPDGTGVRDYIHVSDLVAAHLLLLRHLRTQGRSLTLNCGYGRGYSVREVLDAVERASGGALPVEYAPRRPGDIAALVASPQRLKDLLDWKPQHDDIDVIARHALAWERRREPAETGASRASG